MAFLSSDVALAVFDLGSNITLDLVVMTALLYCTVINHHGFEAVKPTQIVEIVNKLKQGIF
jgi:hypothetical protein